MSALTQATQDFLHAVVNPFKATKPAKVPDALQNESITIHDSFEAWQAVNGDTVACQGALIWVSCGYSNFENAQGNTIGLAYRVNVMPLNADNTVTTPGIFQYAFINEETILGNNGVTIDMSNSLISGIRVMSLGLKVLPTIETVTDTTINYVINYIGGQITPNDLNNIVTDGLDAQTVLKQGTSVKEYSNSEGVTVRYNPFQTDMQLDMIPINTYMSEVYSFDSIKMPCVLVKFSQPVPAVTDPDHEMPIIVWARAWLECELKKPTFIYAEHSPVDPEFNQIRSHMSTANDVLHPLTAAGHSLNPFHLGRFINHVMRAMRAGSTLFRMAGRAVTGRRFSKRQKRTFGKVKRGVRRKVRRRKNGRVAGRKNRGPPNRKIPNNKK
jgi:hypothetical protein